MEDEPASSKEEFKCSHCLKMLKSSNTLSFHLKRYHKDKDPKASHKCPECPQSYYSAGTLKAHVEVSHRGIKKFPCHICGVKFGWKVVLRDHIWNIHTMATPRLKQSNGTGTSSSTNESININARASSLCGSISENFINPHSKEGEESLKRRETAADDGTNSGRSDNSVNNGRYVDYTKDNSRDDDTTEKGSKRLQNEHQWECGGKKIRIESNQEYGNKPLPKTEDEHSRQSISEYNDGVISVENTPPKDGKRNTNSQLINPSSQLSKPNLNRGELLETEVAGAFGEFKSCSTPDTITMQPGSIKTELESNIDSLNNNNVSHHYIKEASRNDCNGADSNRSFGPQSATSSFTEGGSLIGSLEGDLFHLSSSELDMMIEQQQKQKSTLAKRMNALQTELKLMGFKKQQTDINLEMLLLAKTRKEEEMSDEVKKET